MEEVIITDMDGLVHAYLLDEKGVSTPLNSGQIDAWSADKGLLWIHLDSRND